MQLRNRISAPKRKKHDFEARLKNKFKMKSASAKIEKICWQITITTLMHAAVPIRLTTSSCKRQFYARSRRTKQPWRSHYNAISRYWIAKRTSTTTRSGVRNCRSKTGSRRQSPKKKTRLWSTFYIYKGFLKGKSSAPNFTKSSDTSLSLSQLDAAIPLRFTTLSCKRQYSITHAAAAPSNLDAAVMLQNALQWLHECCVGLILGRKPEHETFCFCVSSGCGRRWKVPRVCVCVCVCVCGVCVCVCACAAVAGALVSTRHRFSLDFCKSPFPLATTSPSHHFP